jgi:hypothetical protein
MLVRVLVSTTLHAEMLTKEESATAVGAGKGSSGQSLNSLAREDFAAMVRKAGGLSITSTPPTLNQQHNDGRVSESVSTHVGRVCESV